MKPLRISPRITLQMDNGQAMVESKAKINPIDAVSAVENWIENNRDHPRISDAELWLSTFEQQNPHVRLLKSLPPSSGRRERFTWMTKTIHDCQEQFGLTNESAKQIIITAFPDLEELWDEADQLKRP